jgi:hypothetical protein
MMKRLLSLTSVICLVVSALPLTAQEATPAPDAARSSPNAASRFPDTRLVMRSRGGRVREVTGLLTSDPQSKQVRFEVGDRVLFVAPYDQITAMHYEKDTKDFLTIYYTDTGGLVKVETIRLRASRKVLPTLDALERDTGLTIDRTLAIRSFLGLPIRAALGDTVVLTDKTGEAIEGTLTQLSASSIVLNGSTPAARAFDAASVQRITMPASLQDDLRLGYKWAMIFGASSGVAGGLVAYKRSCEESSPLLSALVGGSAGTVIGIGAGWAAGAVTHAFRKEHASKKEAAYRGALLGFAGGLGVGLAFGVRCCNGDAPAIRAISQQHFSSKFGSQLPPARRRYATSRTLPSRPVAQQESAYARAPVPFVDGHPC